MLGELEAAVTDSLRHLVGGHHRAMPAPGAVCANCDAPLQGPFCHVCGQEADTHKRSILHLIWEAIEGLLHIDGRLWRTLPDLFFRPGRLARDYLDGRIARHVPPFRTFLVALLLFVFAAEHATHELTDLSDRQQAARSARLATPQGRAAEAASMHAEAVRDRDSDLRDAVKDRSADLADPDEDKSKVEARYLREVAKVQARFTDDAAKADRVAAGLPEAAPEVKPSAEGRRSLWREGVRKAAANREYFLSIVFTWAHRLAILLLPIVGLSLALVYRNKRQYFLYDHLLVAMNLMSFSFLTNALVFVMPPNVMLYAMAVVAVWTPLNLFQTLRGAYGSGIAGALLKTLVVWWVTVNSFGLLVIALVLFSLSQL